MPSVNKWRNDTMNLPNKLTVLRILLVPVFVVLFEMQMYFFALVVFCAASITDALDGNIARKRGLVTNFGKLMDPLADKVLVMSAMLCLVSSGITPSWVVIVILAREFLVTSLRLIAVGEGVVIAADRWGKLKTIAQMSWIVAALLLFSIESIASDMIWAFVVYATMILMWASLILSVLSGFNYCYKNRDIFLRDM